MPHRQFADSHGTMWTVWDVHPARVERELEIARASRAGGGSTPAPGRSTLRLDRPYAAGWLCFESTAGKRRLAPIPDRWSELGGEALNRLCEEADPVAPHRRSGHPIETAPTP